MRGSTSRAAFERTGRGRRRPPASFSFPRLRDAVVRIRQGQPHAFDLAEVTLAPGRLPGVDEELLHRLNADSRALGQPEPRIDDPAAGTILAWLDRFSPDLSRVECLVISHEAALAADRE